MCILAEEPAKGELARTTEAVAQDTQDLLRRAREGQTAIVIIQQLVEATESGTPDLALVEDKLPFCSAYDFLEDISSMPNPPEVIVMTEGATESDAVRAFDLGAADVIDSPFRPPVVFARARRTVRTAPRGGRR